jgi:glycosyltransferase involved in cell wall biosynthesis
MSSKFQINTEELAFVIPFKTDHGRREEIFNWNIKRLKGMFPGCQIVIGEQDSELFNLSQARNDGIRKVDRPFLFSLDADTVWNPEIIIDSVHALGKYKWVIPYMLYLNINMKTGLELTQDDPEVILLYANFEYDAELKVPPNDPMPPVSGIVGMKTETMYEVGGFDERCDGWGWDDRIFAYVAEKVLGEPPKRFNHMIYHIWHEVGPTINQPKYHDNWELFREYERHFHKTYRKFL